MKTLYLSPSTSKTILKHKGVFGLLESPRTQRDLSRYPELYWAYDNDAFTGFDEERWRISLEKNKPYKDRCLFIVCPDYVGDKDRTLTRFEKYYSEIKGYPVAFVSQDGMSIEDIPWKHIDAVFIGGTNKHKLGVEAGAIIAEAERKQKWIHVGRVNSRKRLLQFWRANSWDGTTLAIDPSGSRIIARTVNEIRLMKRQEKLI